MKRGILFYNSATGNTRLACGRIARDLTHCTLELRDITDPKETDLSQYDIVGFATFTDYLGPHARIGKFIDTIPRQADKPAFIFSTHESFSGRTQRTLACWAREKGFRVLTGFALEAPGNYPPFIVRGPHKTGNPSEENLSAFTAWIKRLDEIIGGDPANARQGKIARTLLGTIIPPLPRRISKFFMGDKRIDTARCTKCGICRKVCAHGAISMNETPVFDEKKCHGCWACYNHCPVKAVYTRKLRDRGHYPSPHRNYRDKILT